MAWWAGLLAGGAQAGGSAFGNLWAAKERRRSQEWGEKMFERETLYNRQNADTAYGRDLDYGARMDAARKAGINPYSVVSQGYSSPVASSGSAKAGPMAPGDFSAIGKIPEAVMQAQLMNAQLKKTNAETSAIEVGRDSAAFNLELQRKFGGKVQESTLANMEATNRNLNETTGLITAQKGATEVTALLGTIDARFRADMNKMELESRTWSNRESAKRIEMMGMQMTNLAAATDKIKSEIKLNQQALITGQISWGEMAARIRKTMVDANLGVEQIETERQTRENKKWGILGPAGTLGKELHDRFNNR